MNLNPGPEKRQASAVFPAALTSIGWALQENDDWYQDLVENSQDVLAVHDLQGRILSINPTPARLTGYTVEEMLRMPLRELIAPEFRSGFDQYLQEIKRNRESRGLMMVLTRTGERRTWEYRNTLRTEGVAAPIVRCMAHDVTEVMREQRALRALNSELRKKSQEQEKLLQDLKLFRTLLDNSNDAIQVIERESLRFLDVNQTTCIDLGYSREELLQMSVYDISPAYTKENRRRVLAELKEQGFAIFERIHRRKDGSTFPVEVNLREVHLDRPYGVAVTRDITRRKQAEETLRQREADLNRAQSLAHIGSWRFEVEPRRVKFSAEAYRIAGLPIGSEVTADDVLAIMQRDDLPRITDAWMAARKSGQLDVEGRISSGKELRWVRIRAELEYSPDGQTVLAVGTVQDITESKRTATLVEIQERRFHTMFDRSPLGIALAETGSGRLLQANAKFCEIVGRSQGELLGRSFQSFTHPEDIAEDLELTRRFGAGQLTHFELEKRYLRPDGSTRWVKLLVGPAWAQSETPMCHLALVKDITERRRTRERLREFERVVENLDEMILVVDRDYRCTLVNQAFLRYWGKTEEQVIGRSVAEVMSAGLFEEVIKKKVDDCLAGGAVTCEASLAYPGTGLRHLALTCSPVEGPAGAERAACVLRDITESRHAERALRESAARERARAKELETVLETVPVAVCIGHDAECRSITGNLAAYEQMGVPPGSNVSRSAFDAQRPPFRVLENGVEVSPELLPIQQAASTGKPVYGRALTLLLADGSVKETIANVVPLFDEEGRPCGAVAASIDVTGLKQAEDSLRQREETQKLILDHLQVGVILSSLGENKFLYQNPKFLELFGYSGEELSNLGEWWPKVTPDVAYRQWVSQEWHKRMAEASLTKGEIDPLEITVTCRDGSAKFVRVLCKVIGGANFITVVDLTKRRRAEEALRLSEARFRTLFERAPIGMAVMDARSGQFLQMNPRGCEITGRSEAELLRETSDSITHPDDVVQNAEFRQSFESGDAGNRELEKRILLPDGSMRWIRTSAAPLGEGGASGTFISLAQDITDLKRAQLELRLSEDRYRSVILAMSEGIVFHDASGKILTSNNSAEQILGWGKDMQGRGFVDAEMRTVHEDGSPFPGESHPAMVTLRTGHPMSNVVMGIHRPSDGRLAWISVNSIPMFQAGLAAPYAVVTSFKDITEHKRAQDAIATLAQVRAESSEAFFQSMALQLGRCLEADYVIIGELREGEDRRLRTIAFSDHGVIQENFVRDLTDSICQDILQHGTRSCVLGVAAAFPNDAALRQMKAEGYAGTPLLDSRGRAIGIMAALYRQPLLVPKFAESILHLFSTRTAAEIERKRAEDALRDSEERFRVALKHAPIAVFSQDRELRYTWSQNERLSHLTGQLVGKTPSQFLDAEEAERVMALRRRVMETGLGTHHEMQLTRAGKKHYLDATIEPLLDANGAVIGITGACMDVTELREMTEALREAQGKLTEEKLYLQESITTELGFGEIIGRSQALKDTMDRAAKVAPSDATVLLLGETGTGKELVARALHRMSRRQDNSFIKLNCAAIPSGLLESELFGHEKGAFTSAIARKIGRIELANQGTLFLDEIGEIPLELQPKLLRVLQDQEFERLGGTQTIKVDFRLLAATNRDLLQMVNRREFRSDLYYRLHVFPIHTPALRERRDDIPLLVEHFVRECCTRLGKSIASVPTKTMETLMQWPWPGNIRELENFIERSVILSSGSVLQVPSGELSVPLQPPRGETLQEIERERILRALRDCSGRLGGPYGAAARLGLRRTTLQSKLNQMGIRPAEYRD